MGNRLERRRAGMLLHITSLPGAGYCGTFGADARRFIDFLAAAGLQVWQVLPLGPTHEDGCPYQALSVHAGNPDLIDLDWLVDRGWLRDGEAAAGRRDRASKQRALDCASDRFFAADSGAQTTAYAEFLDGAAYWLQGYVLFHALREDFGRRPWNAWPTALRRREPQACEEAGRRLARTTERLRFRQYVFHCQLRELREYANRRDVLLFGDIPIYVDMESADVWAHQGLFDLDADGRPLTVSGVPPDYFCAEGQLWGNPQYNWERMRETGFEWWLQRFASAAQRYDIARIDHFRALQAYWEIPAGADSARQGQWVAAPGRELLQGVRQRYPGLTLVAENLGTIGPEVEALRAEFDLPGMLILQFAFDGNPDNPYLNHRHGTNEIVYTGTHDNDTTLGWYESLDDQTRAMVYRYFGDPAEPMPWMLIHQAMASRANTAVIPLQDFLGLDGRHRMNTPGTLEGNWQWRFTWDAVPAELAPRIRELARQSKRLCDETGPALRADPARRAANH